MTRRVLITGAGGFVGSHLAEGFAQLGDTVTGLDQRFDAATRRRLKTVTLREAALTSETLAALAGFDLIIHGAAITTSPSEFGLSDTAHTKANVDLLLTSLDYALASGARDFVFISSSGVFGSDDGEVLVESTPARSTSPYAAAKRAGEAAIAQVASLRAIAVRLGPVYGPHEVVRATRRNVSLVRQWLQAADAGRPIIVGSPGSVRDWTFAADLAPAIDALLRQMPPLAGVVHLTSAHSLGDADLARTIAARHGTPIQVVPDDQPPRRPMRSGRLDLAKLIAWTPLQAGLDRTAALDFAR